MANTSIFNAFERMCQQTVAFVNSKLEGINGTQPDWNQTDETASDFIKNKTHYVDASVENKTLTWDGDDAQMGNFITNKFGSNLYFYKVSDDIPTINNLHSFIENYQGSTQASKDILYTNNNESDGGNFNTWSNDGFIDIYGCNEATPLCVIISSTYEAGNWFNVDIPETGIYLSYADGYMSELNYSIVTETVHQLDEKFIPESIARTVNLPNIKRGDSENTIIVCDGITCTYDGENSRAIISVI